MKWEDTVAVEAALYKLSRTLGLNNNGEVTVGWYGDFDNCVAALARRADLSPEIPAEQALVMTRKAVLQEFKTSTLNAASLASVLKREEQNYLATPLRTLILVSSASIKFDETIGPRRIEGARIVFRQSIPKKYSPPDVAGSRHENRLPVGYCAVTVTVKARCIHSAVGAAFDSFDLLRAMWNLFYNRSVWRIIGDRAPNEIVTGPFHSLHEPSGQPATQTYWYDPLYLERHPSKDIASDLRVLDRFTRRVRLAVGAGNLGQYIRKLLLRYGRALDERVPATAYLRLWGVLEDATGTAERHGYDVTIRRAASVWPDPTYHQLVLNDLRFWRNALVHQGSELTRGTEVVEELRKYVERLLGFLIGNARFFQDRQQYIEVLNLPFEATELAKRAKLLGWARRWRTPSSVRKPIAPKV